MSLRAMLMARAFQAQSSSAPVADTVREILGPAYVAIVCYYAT